MKKLLDKIFLFRREMEKDWPAGKKVAYVLWRAFLLTCAAVCMGAVVLLFAYGQYSWGAFLGYFKSVKLLALNITPVVLLTFLLYGIFGRIWLSFFVGGIAAMGFSLGHYYKLTFRDDPLYFEDMLILREAGAMASEQNYQPFIDIRVIFVVLCWVFGTLVLMAVTRGVLRGWKKRIGVVLAVVLAGFGLWNTYMDTGLYNSVENYEHLNRWSPTQNYISHGFFYPFLHSITEFVETPPEGYTEKEAQALLAQYQDADIPADKKVNVISIMREAYVDFSLFDIEGLDTSGYSIYHDLQAESLSGDLLVNIFAGGTIDSERGFLSGNFQLKNFRGPANSYLWYLRDQGYTVEGSHPYYQWFYNRQNVNSYLGFENYRFLEGDYENLTKSYLPEDSILYPEVYADFVANKETGKPYFSYVLNIQSHGPYSTTDYNGSVEYLTGDYSQECKNAMNNYMASIMNGDVELMKLVENLRNDSEPVVLVVYNDHLPWMGDGNIFYDELGLDIDPGTEQGFRNHYTTDYLIWANDAAKEVLGNDFVGEGPTLSPCYLMNLVFDQCGWEGPAFMQAMDEMMEVFPVVTIHGCYVIDDQFVDYIPQERQKLFNEFKYLQHYWRNEFLY